MARVCLVVALAVGAGACEADPERDEGAGGDQLRGEGGGPVATGRLTDPQVAALVQLINGTEAAAAKALQPKFVTPAVRSYAATLLADHTRLMEAMPSLPGPRRSPPQAATLRAIFHSQTAMFATLPAGAALDAVFVATQVADHAVAIDSLLRWREAASSAELRRALETAIPVMEGHLSQARALFDGLNPRPAAGSAAPDRPSPRATRPDTLLQDTVRRDPAAREGG